MEAIEKLHSDDDECPMLHDERNSEIHVTDGVRLDDRKAVSLWYVHGSLVLAQVCWGSAAVTNKIGLGGISPVLFAFVREVFAGPILLLLAGCLEGNGRCLPPLPSVRDAVPLVLAGCAIFIDQFCSLAGVKLADSSSLSAWQPSQLVFTTVMAICLGWEGISIGKAVGITFTIIGALMLSLLNSGSSKQGVHPQIGQILFLCNCLASSLYVICTKKALRCKLPPIAVTAWSYMMAALLMLIANLIVASSDTLTRFFCDDCEEHSHFYIPEKSYPYIAYSVVVQSCVGYMAQTWGNQYADASVVSQYAAVQPIVSVSISCILLAIRVNPNNALSLPGWNMLGAPFVLVGLFIVVRSTKVAPEEPTTIHRSSATSWQD